MSDGESISEIFNSIAEWNRSGERLHAILKEVKEEINDAPFQVTEDGRFFLHPLLAKKLNEPGNEGPLEFLRYMQRNGIAKDLH